MSVRRMTVVDSKQFPELCPYPGPAFWPMGGEANKPKEPIAMAV